jgi:hypothetical protein
MKKHWLLVVGVILLLAAAVSLVVSSTQNRKEVAQSQHQHSAEEAKPEPPRIPAHFEVAPAKSSLGPTLPPEKFYGKTKDAYRMVREIPQTIAQLPCYCHCDRGFGHKSLYSCFEDDHASHCAVCVDEALMAYKLEKEEKLGPTQIRDRIIAQYGPQ